jgi:hypothetical protein
VLGESAAATVDVTPSPPSSRRGRPIDVATYERNGRRHRDRNDRGRLGAGSRNPLPVIGRRITAGNRD